MAYKLQIVDQKNNINFNVRYGNLAKVKRPPIEAKAPNSKIVKEKMCLQGQALGKTERLWMDDDGQQYSKTELTFWYEGQQVEENQQTKVFEIAEFQSLGNYTDKYVISAYYEVWADDNGMKKDFDRQRAVQANTYQMRKLWEYLHTNKVVGRGEFCTSSRGFVGSDGYIRAIEIEGKWCLEIGVFKEEKIFEHLNEGIPQETIATPQTTPRKKIKMV